VKVKADDRVKNKSGEEKVNCTRVIMAGKASTLGCTVCRPRSQCDNRDA
jgi:hypothetical protein